jgi:hypothetical protein
VGGWEGGRAGGRVGTRKEGPEGKAGSHDQINRMNQDKGNLAISTAAGAKASETCSAGVLPR